MLIPRVNNKAWLSLLAEVMINMKPILVLVALFASALADATTTSDLLWPQPSSMKFGSGVYTIDDGFDFLGAGAGANSDILRAAFSRYQDLIFNTPTPFYPSGGSAAATGKLKNLTVTVSSSNESLGLKTNESC